MSNNHTAHIRALLERLEGIEKMDSRKRELMMVLLYWKVFNEVDIPDKVLKEIMEKGSKPETIGRLYRKAMKEKREEKLLERLNRLEEEPESAIPWKELKQTEEPALK